MLKSSVKHPRASALDRLFWALFAKYVNGWRGCCTHCTLVPSCVGTEKAFDAIGGGKVGAGA